MACQACSRRLWSNVLQTGGHTKSSQIPLSPPSLLTRPRTRSLHITPPLLESKTKRLARLKKKAVIQQRSQKVAELEATKPDPVLGYGPGREFVWENSELKRLLLGKEEVWAGKAGSERPEGGEGNGTSSSNEASLENPTQPPLLNFGITPSTSSLLFSALPSVSAQRISTMQGTYEAAIEKKQAEVEEEEVNKRERLMRILDLRNADSKGIRLENQRRIVRAFGRPGVGVGEEMEDEKQGDTGREEVRAALLTMRIHSVNIHLQNSPRDVHNQRHLRELVTTRAKVLRYLRDRDVKRYEKVLDRIGVERRAVEGEIILRR